MSLTQTKIDNFEADALTVDKFVNDPANQSNPGHADGSVTSRLGQTFDNLAKISASLNLDYVTLAGTTLTLNAANANTYRGKIILTTSNSPVTITAGKDAPPKFNCGIRQNGSGQVTVAAESGATLFNYDSEYSTAGFGATIALDVETNSDDVSAAWNLNGRTA